VTGINKLDPLIGGRVDQGQDGVAYYGKHLFDTLLLQAADKKMASV